MLTGRQRMAVQLDPSVDVPAKDNGPSRRGLRAREAEGGAAGGPAEPVARLPGAEPEPGGMRTAARIQSAKPPPRQQSIVHAQYYD